MDELMALIARMIRHYHEGGAGYTWLDAAIDMVGEHGYVILNQNGDGHGPAAILINDETLLVGLTNTGVNLGMAFMEVRSMAGTLAEIL